MSNRKPHGRRIETAIHRSAKRVNIPTAETQSFLHTEELAPKTKLYERDADLDPQLVWKGKEKQDAGPLIVETVPIYIQEKIHPKQIIEDLKRVSTSTEPQADLFSEFNGLDDPEAKLEFYAHDQNWSNRMILGDSLLVMNSLAEKEKLRGRVQMIFVDPPYGISFGSNWQASTKSTDSKDGRIDHSAREPEVLKAFRDTWTLGVHSYLSYLRDRLAVARELLTETGSIFVQISDENVHLVRSLLDEIFGHENFVSLIPFRKKTMPFGTNFVEQMADFIIWYAKQKFDSGGRPCAKYRKLFREMNYGPTSGFALVQTSDGEIFRFSDQLLEGGRLCGSKSLEPSGPMEAGMFRYEFRGRKYDHPKNGYATPLDGMNRLKFSNRLIPAGNLLRYALLAEDKAWGDLTVPWFDTIGADGKVYVVQTNTEVVKRCLLMTTDPGDLVIDPTCGSGTTAYVAEQWGRRWITIDTSRVALALARTRLMAARYPYFILKDSKEGIEKEAEITGRPWPEKTYGNDVRLGFVYERLPHITVKSIANNAEIDVIHERWQRTLEPIRIQLNEVLKSSWEEWQIPREPDTAWSKRVKVMHQQWWEARRARQKEIDDSIAHNADTEFLFDRPFENRSIVRVTGPFTVESLSPHRVLPTDEEDEALLDALDEEDRAAGKEPPPRARRYKVDTGSDDFVTVVLENLKAAGVHNTKKNEQLEFISLKPWPGGKYIHADGRYMEGARERRAAVCIGPEYGTVSYQLVRDAAREAVDLFDTLVVGGFAFEPQVGEDTMSLGRLTVLKAHMNQDLHMAEHLKKTGAGHLFVVFGEPEIEIADAGDEQMRVEIKGVDVFDPTTGEVRSGSTDDIACWFIDTNYDGESFFVRHAYFLGAKDPYERLKRTLKAEIDEEAWATLYSATSRPFPKPATGRIAVKVINHYGDEVLKVYKV